MTPNFEENVWSKISLSAFIKCYECYPELYLVSSEDYKNKSRRELAYKKLSKQFEEITNMKISIASIKTKIHSLRTQFNREKNKIKASKSSGATSEEVYTPKLWYFHLLNFLDGTSCQVSCNASNLDIDIAPNDFLVMQEEENGDISIDGTADELNLLSPASIGEASSQNEDSLQNKKRKRVSAVIENDISVILKNATEVMAAKTIYTSPARDGMDDFLQLLGIELRKIKCPKRQRQIKRNITNLVYDGQDEEDAVI